MLKCFIIVIKTKIEIQNIITKERREQNLGKNFFFNKNV